MFTSQDDKQIITHGLNAKEIEQQIKYFREGFPPSDLSAPAIIGHGIYKFSDDEVTGFIDTYVRFAEKNQIVKFVPASGAASRMFKKLFAFKESYNESEEAYQELIADQSEGSMFDFFKRLEQFAFYEDLKEVFATSGRELSEAHLKKSYIEILDYLLEEKGLDYGQLPKGLLKFHGNNAAAKTPVEEHMVEGCQYARSGVDRVEIHFTVSPEHQAKFEKHVNQVKNKYEETFNCKISVSYSIQKPSTDTIAVDLDNQPFREEDGALLFRPAGHGALLENLNDVEADIIFVKNIDNVVPDHLKAETIKFKKVLAGVLVDRQKKIFDYLIKLQADHTEALILEVATFVKENLGTSFANTPTVKDLIAILDRPIRVCGMVKSEGDPGGGPFWVKDRQGNTSLQIVETAQINLDDPDQMTIFNAATHFNPVDLVCGVKDVHGNAYDLMKFRDPLTGFASQKSKNGKDLKAQELPGLWNGSMAHWNSIFVEVPVITFNPVKAVTDLLKPEHQ
jgi:hypothetical protein